MQYKRCFAAVSDTVSSSRIRTMIPIITMMTGIFLWIFPGIVSLLQPPSLHLHRSWFHLGCRPVFTQFFISVLQKPHILVDLPCSCWQAGGFSFLTPKCLSLRTNLHRVYSLHLDYFRAKAMLLKKMDNNNQYVGDKRFHETSS